MPETDWLNLNTQRPYPFVPTADFAADDGAPVVFAGNLAFADAGFTLGVLSAFEHARDSIVLDRYVYGATSIAFVFKTAYGATAPYEAMQCYEWVFVFDLAAEYGATTYTVPTRITAAPDEYGEENPAMGLAFLTVGQLDAVLTTLSAGVGYFTATPQLEPAVLQSNVNTFAEHIKLANEPRPCPPACPCESSSSSSSSSDSSAPSSAESSSSSSSAICDDPTPPEPDDAYAPTRLPLPGGTMLGDVLLKPGYNSTIEVIAASNIVTLSAGLGRGDGMQCEDLRTDDDGNLTAETCRSCGGLVYAVNDTGYSVEHLQLVGGPGSVITPDADNHCIYVQLEEEGICNVEV